MGLLLGDIGTLEHSRGRVRRWYALTGARQRGSAKTASTEKEKWNRRKGKKQGEISKEK